MHKNKDTFYVAPFLSSFPLSLSLSPLLLLPLLKSLY
jgi:hypothetical protein